MLRNINQFMQHVFTARDGISYSMTKLVGVSAAVVMIVQFVRTHSTDFQDFSLGIAGIMTALAIKYAVEDKK